MVYGQCTNCGSVEVELVEQDGTQDLSDIGEDPKYPFGAPCEVCKDRMPGWRSETAPDGWMHGTTYADSPYVAK
jgi:hypothetical protein